MLSTRGELFYWRSDDFVPRITILTVMKFSKVEIIKILSVFDPLFRNS